VKIQKEEVKHHKQTWRIALKCVRSFNTM